MLYDLGIGVISKDPDPAKMIQNIWPILLCKHCIVFSGYEGE